MRGYIIRRLLLIIPTLFFFSTIVFFFISTPEFFIAILVMIYPVLWFGWAPSVTMIRWSEDPPGAPGDDPGTRYGVGVADQRHDDSVKRLSNTFF